MLDLSRRAAALAVIVITTMGGVLPAKPPEKITIKIVWDNPKLSPVFDCTNPEIRREYPAQCPELPFLLGGGQPQTGGGGGRGVLGGILHSIPGLGGLF
jgi:hypothetical protein